MSAHTGNRYAEKWTEERTLQALEKINKFAMMDDTLYLGMALARAGYYDDIWRYWRRKWACHHAIIHEMKQLSQHFEARLFQRAATGKMPVSLGMFALRHHYGWGKEQQAQEDMSYMKENDLTQTSATADGLSEGEGFNTNGHLTQTSATADGLSKGEGLMQTAGSIQTLSEGEGFNTNGHLTQTSATADGLSKGEGLIQTAGSIQTLSEGEGFNTNGHLTQTSATADGLSKGEGLMQTAGSIQTLSEGEGFNTNGHLTQTSATADGLSKGEGLMQTAGSIQTLSEGEGFNTNGHLTQTSATADGLSKGEGLMQTAGSIQTLSEGEGFNAADAAVEQVEPDDLTVSDTAPVADPSTTAAAIDVSDEHCVKMTPDEELLAEAGVSSIAEIKRLMREEDEDLAEFDDMDEDLEWEVETPQTYR